MAGSVGAVNPIGSAPPRVGVGRQLSKGTWIGTSGWTYEDWKGPFYPNEVPKQDWLRWYATQFQTTERDCQIVCVRGFRDGGARFVVCIESEASEAWSARLLGCSKRSSPRAA